MAHFARVINGEVTQVIVAEQDYINTLIDASDWIQTSYNTREGVHLLGGTPLRKNFAGVGYVYDSTLDAFIPPKSEFSYVLDEDKCIYVPPKPMPNDGKSYQWKEKEQEWIVVEPT